MESVHKKKKQASERAGQQDKNFDWGATVATPTTEQRDGKAAGLSRVKGTHTHTHTPRYTASHLGV